MSMKILVYYFCLIFCSTLLIGISGEEFKKGCNSFQDNDRFDCYPEPNGTQKACAARGCCWAPPVSNKNEDNVPRCFFPTDFLTYKVDQLHKTDRGYTASLTKSTQTFRPKDILNLRLDIVYETESRIRIKISDRNAQRWEVPLALGPPDTDPPKNVNYYVNITQNPFGIAVIRKSDKLVLFDSITTKAPLMFADQFLQMSTRLHVSKVYGIGENRKDFLFNLSQWSQIGLWTRDQPPQRNSNLYGVHNIYMGLTNDGSAYGVFFLNSNAHEVMVQPLPAFTYRTIGGVLDFFIFTGETPSDVIQQYVTLIGTPMFPPYWSLGFHLSRWGYNSLKETNKTFQRNLAANMPFDCQWNDIDYASNFRDWTYDPKRYAGLPEFVNDVHNKYGMHYLMLIDPTISNKNPDVYPPYETGLRAGLFINRSDGSGPLEGKSWYGATVYPDFTHPEALAWWTQSAKSFHEKVAFDGFLIDMNEISNLVDGSTSGCPWNELNYPPYVPKVVGGTLWAKSVCPSAKHYLSTHYNVHSMYGYYEAKVTHEALEKVRPNKRQFIISRATFAGSGRYTFHWSGDNQSTWESMYYSIMQILNFNMFGIPMVGANTCGFGGPTTEELCTRWTQLAAFYPYMWNHNDMHTKEQDPAAWSPTAQDAMRKALEMRYSLIPYTYTLFYHAHRNGTTVARPLFFEFPDDPATHAIDKQFMIGPSLLITPVLVKGARKVQAYIPDSSWCDIHTLTRVQQRKTLTILDAPLNTINVHIRGGSILPMLPPARTTALSRFHPFSLLVCLENEKAKGSIFWDDGESILPETDGQFNLINFVASPGQLLSLPQHISYKAEKMTLAKISLIGVPVKPKNITVNEIPTQRFTFNSVSMLLSVWLVEDMATPIAIKWT